MASLGGHRGMTPKFGYSGPWLYRTGTVWCRCFADCLIVWFVSFWAADIFTSLLRCTAAVSWWVDIYRRPGRLPWTRS